MQCDRTRDVLAEVHHENAGLGVGDLLGGEGSLPADGLEDHGAHLAAGGGDSLDGELVALVEVLIQGGVKGLAVEDGGGAGVKGAFPGGVGDDILGSAVLIVNMKVSPQDAVAVELDLAGTQHTPHEVGAVLAPAGGDLDLYAVLSLLQTYGIVNPIVAGLCVVGVGGVQRSGAYGLSVDGGLMVAQTAEVHDGVLHGLTDGKVLDEAQYPFTLILSRGDPLTGEGIEATVEEGHGPGIGITGGGLYHQDQLGGRACGEIKEIQNDGLAFGLHAVVVDRLSVNLHRKGIAVLLGVVFVPQHRPRQDGGGVAGGELADLSQRGDAGPV